MNRIVEFAIATAFAVLPVSCRELPFETQILSYEGDFLLKIFRQTGDRRYLELCKDISHNVIQYVNTKNQSCPAWRQCRMECMVQLAQSPRACRKVSYGDVALCRIKPERSRLALDAAVRPLSVSLP